MIYDQPRSLKYAIHFGNSLLRRFFRCEMASLPCDHSDQDGYHSGPQSIDDYLNNRFDLHNTFFPHILPTTIEIPFAEGLCY